MTTDQQTACPKTLIGAAKFLDLEMLIFPGGLERTEMQFREIFSAAGWKLERVIATASGVSIVEGAPA